MRKILGIILERMKKQKMNKDRREAIIKKCGCPCLACKGKIPEMNSILIDELLKLEYYLEKQVNINSGQRCPAYNTNVGGYPNSAHVFGEAVDITVIGIELITLAKICEEMAFLRIGIYPNHIHLDMVKPCPSRFWLVKKYGDNPIYSGNIKSLDEFLKRVR